MNHKYIFMSRNSYQTEVLKVNYGSRQLGLGNFRDGQGRLIFDSGSSYSYFTVEAYNNLVNMVSKYSLRVVFEFDLASIF